MRFCWDFFILFLFLGNDCSLTKKAFCMFHSPYLRVAQERIFCRFSLSISCGTNHIEFFEVHCRICCLICESAQLICLKYFSETFSYCLLYEKITKNFTAMLSLNCAKFHRGLFYIFPCQRRAILDTCSLNH